MKFIFFCSLFLCALQVNAADDSLASIDYPIAGFSYLGRGNAQNVSVDLKYHKFMKMDVSVYEDNLWAGLSVNVIIHEATGFDSTTCSVALQDPVDYKLLSLANPILISSSKEKKQSKFGATLFLLGKTTYSQWDYSLPNKIVLVALCPGMPGSREQVLDIRLPVALKK